MGYEQPRGAQISAEKAGATERIQSAEEVGSMRKRGNVLRVIFQDLLFQKKFEGRILGVDWW